MRLLLAFLLIGFGSTVTCLSLEPLCASDHFLYQNVRVNAIHRVQTNVTLEPVSNFVVPPSDDCLNQQWTYDHTKLEAEEIKDYYNKMMIGVYSEQFLNSKFTNNNSFKMKFERTHEKLSRMNAIAEAENKAITSCLKEKYIQPMKNGIELIRHLASLYTEKLPQTDEQGLRLGKSTAFRKFESEIDRMEKHLTDSQTMAFHFDLINEAYRKPIVRMGKFVFHKKSKVIFDLSSYGVVNFEIIFPFEDTELQAGKDCVSTADLPQFFPNP